MAGVLEEDSRLIVCEKKRFCGEADDVSMTTIEAWIE